MSLKLALVLIHKLTCVVKKLSNVVNSKFINHCSKPKRRIYNRVKKSAHRNVSIRANKYVCMHANGSSMYVCMWLFLILSNRYYYNAFLKRQTLSKILIFQEFKLKNTNKSIINLDALGTYPCTSAPDALFQILPFST